jgi:hypothetical protein
MPGPIPKRSEELMGHLTKAQRAERTEGQAPGAEHVEIPEPDPEWNPIARRWYDSLAESGQSRFYEPSDWATAVYVAEAMSRNLRHPERFNAQLFATVLSASRELLTTEGARRQLRLELQRPRAGDSFDGENVAAIANYRKHIAG